MTSDYFTVDLEIVNGAYSTEVDENVGEGRFVVVKTCGRSGLCAVHCNCSGHNNRYGVWRAVGAATDQTGTGLGWTGSCRSVAAYGRDGLARRHGADPIGYITVIWRMTVTGRKQGEA